MKKVLLPMIIIILILVTIFQSVLSANATFIKEEKGKLQENNYKDYWNCRIRSKNGEVDGKAYLFPGFFSSWPGSDSKPGVDVNRAFGILIGKGDHWTNLIYFDDDHYYINWIKAYVFSFNGYFSNYMYSPWRVFEIDGTAKFVRVYYS